MIDHNDFRNAEGSIDWAAFRRARVNQGELCSECYGFLPYASSRDQPIGQRMCSDCRDLLKNEEVSHSKFVRCPQCSEKWDPYETEDYDLLADGTHTVECYECSAKFKVTTDVSYTFRSPARQPSSDTSSS